MHQRNLIIFGHGIFHRNNFCPYAISSVVFVFVVTAYTGRTQVIMPRGVLKENLPSKICVVCGRPYSWRKKWERVWDEVSTCSKSCNRKRKSTNHNDRNKHMDSGNNNAEKIVEIEDDSFSSAGSDSIDRNFINQIVEGKQNEIQSTLDDSLDKYSLFEDDTVDEINCVSNRKNANESSPPALDDLKAQRKAEKKRKKEERRAQKLGQGDPTAGQKKCTVCNLSVNLLIRCTYDSSGQWGMVCGKCWKTVSGGVVDGDAAHPHYRYGGLWKNRRAQQKT